MSILGKNMSKSVFVERVCTQVRSVWMHLKQICDMIHHEPIGKSLIRKELQVLAFAFHRLDDLILPQANSSGFPNAFQKSTSGRRDILLSVGCCQGPCWDRHRCIHWPSNAPCGPRTHWSDHLRYRLNCTNSKLLRPRKLDVRAAVVSMIGSWNMLKRWVKCFLRWLSSFNQGCEIAGVNPATVMAQNPWNGQNAFQNAAAQGKSSIWLWCDGTTRP